MTTSLPLRPWTTPEITSWNRLPMHSVPHRAGDPGVERVELDGRWRFELFGTPEEALGAGGLATEIALAVRHGVHRQPVPRRDLGGGPGAQGQGRHAPC